MKNGGVVFPGASRVGDSSKKKQHLLVLVLLLKVVDLLVFCSHLSGRSGWLPSGLPAAMTGLPF